jgi:hypothetical protein
MQDRNAEMVTNLTQDFTRRNEFNESGARLADTMTWMNRDGGGALMWGFSAQSVQNYGAGVGTTYTTAGAIDFTNYAATAHGGPYITLDGVGEYLHATDATWQESGTLNFLVWFWVYPTVITTGTVAAKWDANAGNLRSWRIYLTDASVFGFQTNPTGGAGVGLALPSTLTVTADTWYFVAGYLQPSTLQAIAVGAATDATLTYTSSTTGVSAGVFDGASDLYLGVLMAVAGLGSYFTGRLGIGLARANVPATNIQSHMTRLFQATKWFYQE